ncbi:hypothetical protein [Agromyces marinus]|uniref:Lipocalin-like domain-containing protein n=1 Tax=Agromyces marinus TaxID=1389020 RepID=A0ABN6YDP9_9MICO|nr:hypothetical protein [Agromyces marinus]BDZ55206.1 hypothetical protein GCM10025870_22790 [Agromyces marinus]
MFGTVGCTGFFAVYPHAEEPADVVGTWVHGSGRLVLKADGTFEMADMPKRIIDGHGPRSKSTETAGCAGSWTLYAETQSIYLTATSGDCRGGQLLATGRNGEMTIAFGIGGGTDDPRCFELVRSRSNLEPRDTDECLWY